MQIGEALCRHYCAGLLNNVDINVKGKIMKLKDQ